MAGEKNLNTVSIFLLGSGPNLVSEDEAEQDAKTDEILKRFGIDLGSKFIIREEAELNKLTINNVDVLIVFPCCMDRFTPLIRVADSKLPMLIVGEENSFPDALDTYAYLSDHPNVEIAFTAEEAKNKLKTLEAAKWVKAAKVCVFGLEDLKLEQSAWYKNPMGLGKLNTQPVNKEKAIEAFRNTDMTEAESLAKKWFEECEVKEPSFEDIVLSARVYLALKSILEETNADAAYVPWCGQFTSGFGTKMCFAIAKVADEGVPIGCWRGENLLPMLVLHAISKKPVFVCEANLRQGKIISLRHCFAPATIANCKYTLRRWRNMEHTVTGYCQLPKGTVTLVNCGIGDKILITKGQVLDCKDLEGDNCRITICVELENEETIRKFVGREFAMVYGDYEKDAKETSQRLGLQVL